MEITLSASVLTDSAGCGFYRMKSINDTLSTDRHREFRFMESESPIRDETFLKECSSIRLQRMYHPVYMDYMKWLKDLSLKSGFKIVIDYDDIITFEEIPAWNNCKGQSIGCDSYIQKYLEMADLITVSSPVISSYYSSTFDIPKNKFKVIPNYVPHWWIGYNDNFSSCINKLATNKKRILFCCSTSHFDERGINNGVDDFSSITDWIKANVDKYEFCFQGGFPISLADVKSKCRIYKGEHILNYIHARRAINPALIIQPIQDCLFNRAKSNIKHLEAWATGVPILTSDVSCYHGDKESCFSSIEDLDRKTNKLINDSSVYLDYIERHFKKMSMYWLENNINKWETVING